MIFLNTLQRFSVWLCSTCVGLKINQIRVTSDLFVTWGSNEMQALIYFFLLLNTENDFICYIFFWTLKFSLPLMYMFHYFLVIAVTKSCWRRALWGWICYPILIRTPILFIQRRIKKRETLVIFKHIYNSYIYIYSFFS